MARTRADSNMWTCLRMRAKTIVAFVAALVVFLYGWLLLRAHEHMLSEQSSSGGQAKEINVILDNIEKESAQLASLVASLDQQMQGFPKVPASSASRETPKAGALKVAFEPSSSTQPPALPPTLPNGMVIPPPQTFNSQLSSAAESVLLVCGTDGSGTRRVVDVLTELGVPMVSEDPETFDIHADLLGGWPPIVHPLLQTTKALSYDPSELERTQPFLHRQLTAAVNKLVSKAALDSHKPTSYKLAVGGLLPRAEKMSASGVQFGFKAPVAMTLGPYWSHVIPHFKLLHVVRDGRDIAFSANQGPVEKFYGDMYGAAGANLRGLSPPLMAMRLWSDWNSQIFDWAQARAQAIESSSSFSSSSSSSSSFGYLVLHSEDLVSPIITQRFAAIASLAHWVNSNATDLEICCIALQDAEYLGSHDRIERHDVRNAQQHVASKYGKWRALLRGDKALEKRLNDLGQRGLRGLGYEPPRPLAEEGAAAFWGNGFVCSRQRQQRGDLVCPRNEKPLPYKVDDFAFKGCSVLAGTDYKGDGSSDIETMGWEQGAAALGLAASSNDNTWCCRLCQLRRASQKCRAFTVDVMNRVCFLKRRRGTVVANERTTLLVSGDLV